MRHIRKSIEVCASCDKTWAMHSDAERKSTGLCMWYNLDTMQVCKLLLPCPLDTGKGFGLAHWRDPNSPVRLGFIEEDFKERIHNESR